MKAQLSIRLPGVELQPDTMLDWARFSGEDMESGRATLAEIGKRWGGRDGPEVSVIVPGAEVLLTSTRIPTRQLRQVKRALPYMVEELIAEPIEHVHLAIPAQLPDADQELPVAVIKHERLIPWLDQLYGQGLRLTSMVPETLAVPWQPGCASVLVDGSSLIWRDGPHQGFELIAEEAPLLLEWLAGDAGPPPELVRCYGHADNPGLQPLAQQLREELSLDVETLVLQPPETVWTLLASTARRHPEASINLLQGGYKVQREHGAENSGWQVAAGVAAVGLLGYVLLTAGSSAWFDWRAEQMQERTVELYRELFPDQRRVISPRRQMAAQLRGGNAEPVLELLAATTHLGEGLRLEQLRYRGADGELQLELRGESLDQLDSAKQALQRSGIQARVAAARETEEGTRGRLLLRSSPR